MYDLSEFHYPYAVCALDESGKMYRVVSRHKKLDRAREKCRKMNIKLRAIRDIDEDAVHMTYAVFKFYRGFLIDMTPF